MLFEGPGVECRQVIWPHWSAGGFRPRQLGVRVVGALADGLMQADRCGQVLGGPAGLRRAAEAVRDGGRDPGAA